MVMGIDERVHEYGESEGSDGKSRKDDRDINTLIGIGAVVGVLAVVGALQ